MEKRHNPIAIFALGLLIFWRIVYCYWSVIVNRYMVPPGDDAAYHIGRVQDFLNGHFVWFPGGYPPGFHLLAGFFASIFHMSALTAVLYLAPAIFILPVITIYFSARYIFKSSFAGLFASLAWGLIALAPQRAFVDGNYPNILAASVILPLALMALVAVSERATWKRIVSVILLTLLIGFVHHLSLIFWFIAATPFSLWAIGKKFLSGRIQTKKLYVAIGALIIIGFLGWFVAGHSLYVAYIVPLLASKTDFANATTYYGGAMSWRIFLETHNAFYVWLGLISAVAMLFIKDKNFRPGVKILFISWIAILVFLSLYPIFGFSGRFAREVAIPLAFVTGWLGDWLYRRREYHPALVILAVIVPGLTIFDFYRNFRMLTNWPEPYRAMTRVQHDEEPAIDYLKTTNISGKILANNANPYLPYLVNKPVTIVLNPEITQDTLKNVSVIYIAARPPLTPEKDYPYYTNFDKIVAALEALPNKVLVQQLDNGSKIYLVRKNVTK